MPDSQTTHKRRDPATLEPALDGTALLGDSIRHGTGYILLRRHGPTWSLAEPTPPRGGGPATAAEAGAIQVLVNCAGITGPNAAVDDYAVEDWRRVGVTGRLAEEAHVAQRQMHGGTRFPFPF
jgi:hypothetical protein